MHARYHRRINKRSKSIEGIEYAIISTRQLAGHEVQGIDNRRTISLQWRPRVVVGLKATLKPILLPRRDKGVRRKHVPVLSAELRIMKSSCEAWRFRVLGTTNYCKNRIYNK